MPSRASRLGKALVRVLLPRLPFLLSVASVLLVGYFAWRVVSAIVVGGSDQPVAGIAKVENGRFLGLAVHDNTSDQLMQNPYLRIAMNEGFRSGDVVRRHQMAEIWLQDGQHPETGESAAIIVVKPKYLEHPRPPFESIAVRRWEPEPGKVVTRETILARQRTRSPNEEDLARIRYVWSGHRYKEISSLVVTMRRLFAVVVVAMALILVAGIYRSYVYLGSQAGMESNTARDRAATGKLRAARETRRTHDQMDQPGN